jgi:ABC-type Fe3+/spermidine/putrescine transport system ATPase subunit
MVFQDHPLFPHLSVAANLGFGLRLRKHLLRKSHGGWRKWRR